MTEPYDPNYPRDQKPRRGHLGINENRQIITGWLPTKKPIRTQLSKDLYDVAIQLRGERLTRLSFDELQVIRDMIDILSATDATPKERYAAAVTLMEGLSDD